MPGLFKSSWSFTVKADFFIIPNYTHAGIPVHLNDQASVTSCSPSWKMNKPSWVSPRISEAIALQLCLGHHLKPDSTCTLSYRPCTTIGTSLPLCRLKLGPINNLAINLICSPLLSILHLHVCLAVLASRLVRDTELEQTIKFCWAKLFINIIMLHYMSIKYDVELIVSVCLI